MRNLLDSDMLLSVRSYGSDIKYFVDDSDTYLKLLQCRNGFDQWQFYYDLLQFTGAIDEYIPFMKIYKESFRQYFKAGNSIQRLNDINKKIKNTDQDTFSTIVNYIIPLHPYADYTIIGTAVPAINKAPVCKVKKEYQPYDENLWQGLIWDIVKTQKDIMPYIYKGIKPLDFLLNKWLSISSDIEYAERIGSNVRDIDSLTLDPRVKRGLAYMSHDLDRMPYITKSAFTPLPHDLLW